MTTRRKTFDQKLSYMKFRDSGEIPPADMEAWIDWQWENHLITDDEALRSLAAYRSMVAAYRENEEAPEAEPETVVLEADDE